MTKFYFEQSGKTIYAKVAVSDSINAWEGRVILDRTPRTPPFISTARSIVSIWQTPPNVQAETIAFRGGIPKGFTGEGILFEFDLAEEGEYHFSFDPETAAYLNDGRGTKDEVSLQEASMVISGTSSIVIDTIPPESFAPIRYQEEGFFDSKPVLMFGTSDRESGIAHYEILEVGDHGEGEWRVAESPYLISEEVNVISVKAVDYFGNERIETVVLKTEISPVWFAIGAIILVLLVAISVYNKRKWGKRAHL